MRELAAKTPSDGAKREDVRRECARRGVPPHEADALVERFLMQGELYNARAPGHVKVV